MNDMPDQVLSVEQRFRDQLVRLSLEDSRRRTKVILITIGAVIAAAAILGAVAYQTFKLSERADHLRSEVASLNRNITELQKQSQQLQETQKDLLQFLHDVTSGESIHLIDFSVDWDATQSYLISFPASRRKSAVLSAILLAWKDLPFSIQNRNLRSGLDSPHFINAVLSRYQVGVTARAGERLSDAMMRSFQRSDHPQPGDLLFYRGDVGSFVLMYIAPGIPDGHGVAVGTLETGNELHVLDTAFINTSSYPFIGSFRVPYGGFN